MEFFGQTSERYVGEYARDLREGLGNAYNEDGSLKYSGAWRQGRPHGTGTAYVKLHDSTRNTLTIQKLHGTFVNGIYLGPTDQSTSKNSQSSSNEGSKGNFLLRYGKTLSVSLYQMISTLITNVIQPLFQWVI